MPRYVICSDVALYLAERGADVSAEHRLLAPTLIRSQVLSRLYHDARNGLITKRDADRRLNYLRGLRIRLLGDRSLQQHAWEVAARLGWSDTWDAEYVALTKLQADALISLDQKLVDEVKGVVPVAPVEALF